MLRRLFVLFVLLAVACSYIPTALPDTAQPATNAPTRSATLHELGNRVYARSNAVASFAAAADGQRLPEQGEVRTGDSSQVLLVFSDGGTVRLAQDSGLVIEQLAGTNSDPLTRVKFDFGMLWVSLTSGQFEAQTPLGVATTRGSFAEFQYDPGADPKSTEDDVLTIKCIKGACTFDNGTTMTTLVDLTQLVIGKGGQTISGPTYLPATALAEFLIHNDNAAAPSATQPTPTERPVPSDTATASPTATSPPTPTATDTNTNTPLPTKTKTRRPPPPVTDTPPPTDTPLPTDTPQPTATNTPQPPPPPPPAPTATQPPAPSPTMAPSNPPPPTQTPSRVPPLTKTPPTTP